MMNLLYLLVFVNLLCGVDVQFTKNPTKNLRYYRSWRIRTQNRIQSTIQRDNNQEILRARNKLQPLIDPNIPFPCPLNNSRSLEVPTNIHKLRPGDVDVIGAIGDSLTVGIGLTAKNLREVYFENRQLAPTSGGAGTWRQFLTIPNILKEFNPNLIGYAEKPALTIEKESLFNVADTAAISSDIPNMAKILLKRLKSHPKVDFENDWKLISMMIGPNDFCLNMCYQGDVNSVVANHRKDLIKTLRILRDNIPRLFVSIILAPNLRILINFINRPIKCFLSQLFVCPCLIGEPFKKNREKYVELMTKWQDVEVEVANLQEFDRDDFTVVIQPFPRNFEFPKTSQNVTDYTFLSEDCFHFSQKGNAMMANSIWNNMLEPVGRKTTKQTSLFQKFECPSLNSPYLYTRRNS